MTQQTPLEMLIEKLEENKLIYEGSYAIIGGINVAIGEARSLLPAERQMVEEACKAGMSGHVKSASDYFTSKYGNK